MPRLFGFEGRPDSLLRGQLERVLGSKTFAGSVRLQKLLGFIIEVAEAGIKIEISKGTCCPRFLEIALISFGPEQSRPAAAVCCRIPV
jgi:hypothetical protein